MIPKKKYYKVSGNEKIGYRLIIPKEAYAFGGFPKAYRCMFDELGRLVYHPVSDDEAHP